MINQYLVFLNVPYTNLKHKTLSLINSRTEPWPRNKELNFGLENTLQLGTLGVGVDCPTRTTFYTGSYHLYISRQICLKAYILRNKFVYFLVQYSQDEMRGFFLPVRKGPGFNTILARRKRTTFLCFSTMQFPLFLFTIDILCSIYKAKRT